MAIVTVCEREKQKKTSDWLNPLGQLLRVVHAIPLIAEVSRVLRVIPSVPEL